MNEKQSYSERFGEEVVMALEELWYNRLEVGEKKVAWKGGFIAGTIYGGMII